MDDVDLQDVVAAMKGRLVTWCARYVDPALDGTKEPVMGKGQIDRAGTTGEGRRAYEDDWWYIDEDGRRRDDQAFFLGKVMRKGGDDEMAKHSHKRPTKLERFWYGATYYPGALVAREDREHDAERMAEAGFNCVRMAEFAWGPAGARGREFHFELFDEVIAELGAKRASTRSWGRPRRHHRRAGSHATTPRCCAWMPMAGGCSTDHDSMCVPAARPSVPTRARSRGRWRITMPTSPSSSVGRTDNELNCHFSECHREACQARSATSCEIVITATSVP